MAIYNAQITAASSGGGGWQVVTDDGKDASTALRSSVAFGPITEEPKRWFLAGVMHSSYFNAGSSTAVLMGAYYTPTEGTATGGHATLQDAVVRYFRNSGRVTGTYNSSKEIFTVTANSTGLDANLQFPMYRSSYGVTWYLFYTV